MRFTVTIDCDNAAFEPDPTPEVVRLLGLAAERCVMSFEGTLLDANGKDCGGWTWDR